MGFMTKLEFMEIIVSSKELCHLIITHGFFAGVTTIEILVSHITSQVLCVLTQTALVLILSFWAFHTPCTGNLATAAALVALQGFCGMCFGKENGIHISSYMQVSPLKICFPS
jgi:hypothetical protein